MEGMTLFTEFPCHFLGTVCAGSHGAVDGVCHVFIVQYVHSALGGTLRRGNGAHKLLGGLTGSEKHFSGADDGPAHGLEEGAVIALKALCLGGLNYCVDEVVEICGG